MLNLQRREFDQALRTLATLEKAQPDNTMLYNMKGAAYMGKGDAAQAAPNWNGRSKSIQPSSRRLLILRGLT